jgi:predicted HD superfamily hydrolase involved in NAD metabolism
MNEYLAHLVCGAPRDGTVCERARALLVHHGRVETVAHSKNVADEAQRLARRWGVNGVQSAQAGWLHDISAIVPPEQRLRAAERLGIKVLVEERAAPMILHQKLSAVIAAQGLGVDDAAVLSAVGCHTTLKAGASVLDKVLFVADKIAWDPEGVPPYLDEVAGVVMRSLDLAAYRYLAYLWQRRASLPVVHPWMSAAYRDLSPPCI